MDNKKPKFEKGYRLDKNTYLCEFDTCLAIAKVDDKGTIIRVTTFGNRKDGDQK